MGIVVRLPSVPPKRRPSRLRRSGLDITAALVSTNDSLRAFGTQAVILQQPWLLPISCYWWYWVIIEWYWVNIGWYWSLLDGTWSLLDFTGQYLLVLGQYLVVLGLYWLVLVST